MAPRQQRDLLLLKTALGGEDFQTARRELGTVAETSTPQSTRLLGTSPGWNERSTSSGELDGFSLELSHLDITVLQAEVRTPQGELRVEAVNLTYEHLDLRSTSRVSTQRKDPLVIDMDSTGPRTTGRGGAHAFDLAGDGEVHPTSFVTGRSAFLALDRDGNGRIDDGGELFGDQHGAADGYGELSKFDGNADGRIDAADPVFGSLQLIYGDGRASSLAEAGIQSLEVRATPGTGSTSAGDSILYTSRASTTDGRTLQTYALALQRFDQTV